MRAAATGGAVGLQPLASLPHDHVVVTTIRVRLTGPDAHLGLVPAADVARMLLGIERVVARASGHVLGRQLRATGRWGSLIENAVRFRLVAIEENSVGGLLQLPDMAPVENSLGLQVETLGELALTRALLVAHGESSEADVAQAFADWADDLGVGDRYESLDLEPGQTLGISRVVVDPPAVERLRAVAQRPEPLARLDTLTGLLFEADFERDTAHLRTPDGNSVTVTFGPDMSDAIHRALRHRTSLAGEVQYDPTTARAVSIRLRDIARPEQLRIDLAPETFFENAAARDLVIPGRPAAGNDLRRLQDPDASTEEVDAFMAALAEL